MRKGKSEEGLPDECHVVTSSLLTTTLLFECRSIPLNFIMASFRLKWVSPTLTLKEAT
jgi:hypothetical protein